MHWGDWEIVSFLRGFFHRSSCFESLVFDMHKKAIRICCCCYLQPLFFFSLLNLNICTNIAVNQAWFDIRSAVDLTNQNFIYSISRLPAHLLNIKSRNNTSPPQIMRMRISTGHIFYAWKWCTLPSAYISITVCSTEIEKSNFIPQTEYNNQRNKDGKKPSLIKLLVCKSKLSKSMFRSYREQM